MVAHKRSSVRKCTRSELTCCIPESSRVHLVNVLRRAAGRELPPLFNWQKGELDGADPAIVAVLQPRRNSAS